MAKVVKSKRVTKKPTSSPTLSPTLSIVAKRKDTKAKTIVAPKKVLSTKTIAAKTKPVAAKAKVAEATQEPSKKLIAKKLLETIEKRKLARAGEGADGKKPNPFGRPPGRRRGRRPKNIEYNPENREDEENYVVEEKHEGLEYDTGIRVTAGRDDGSVVFERSDDFDEELNFDW